MNKESKQLVFVYNANSNWFNKVVDFSHKIISPNSYQCELCSLTHGAFGPKEEWLKFIETLDYEVKFSYKNELDIKQRRQGPPFILVGIKGSFKELISKEELIEIDTTIDLIQIIKERLV